MTTASDLIESAVLKIGAKATGETLTASEAADSLKVLNSMLDSWSIDRLYVYQIVQGTHTWTGGAGSMTIGVSGAINTTRPVKIEDGTFFRDSHNIDTPVKILRERSSYDRIVSKVDTTSFPLFLFYDPAYPLGTIYVYPVPISALTLKLNTWKPLQNFTDLTTDLALPPGYQWAIEHNLAIHLSPVFALPVPPDVRLEAKISRSRLKQINNVPIVSEIEVSYVLRAGRRSDIKAGTG